MKKIALILGCSLLFFACGSDDSIDDSGLPVDDTMTDDTPETVLTAPCVDGLADIFPCNDYDLLYRIELSTFNAAAGNDSWGWTDPSTGKEYALMGLDNGTAFVDISDPEAAVYLGKLPTHTASSDWRDVKVYSNHAFIVSEAEGHGMQVFDLTRLRNVSGTGNVFTEDAHYDGFGNAHNIVINEDSGYAYAVGTQTFNGGPHFINIQNPTSPVAAGGYELSAYSHDAQVVTYSGPDTEHSGKELLIGSNVNEIVIVDITDKDDPVLISQLGYGEVGYTHQGWFTEDQKYFILGDELDELSFGFNSRTLVFDFTDLDIPVLHTIYNGPNPAIDHNGYVHNGLFYLANYTGGLRVISLADIENGNLTEVGSFDTYPSDNAASFNGVLECISFF